MEQIKAQLAQAYAQEFLEVRLLEPSSDRRYYQFVGVRICRGFSSVLDFKLELLR
jgi:hypothetical protein